MEVTQAVLEDRAAAEIGRRESVAFPDGSACGPVIVPVFKTGGRRVFPSPVGSTPTRFRQNLRLKQPIFLDLC